MHYKKNTIFALLIAVLFFACAGSNNETASSDAVTYRQSQEEKLALLEKTYATMQEKVMANVPPESLLEFITDSSRYWMDSLQLYAKTSPKADVETKQFCEILAVLFYRVNEYEKAWKPNMNSDYRMLSLVTGKAGLIQRAAGLKLGPFEVKNDRGSVGLANSPKVPVIIFKWDDQNWKMDLRATLPLVTKGLESIGAKKNWTNTELALYLLEKEFHYKYTDIKFDETLLDPVPEF